MTGTILSPGIVPDPEDDGILGCAIVGGASYLVTRDDKHLLPIGVYQGVQIVQPHIFLDLIR